MIRLFRRVVLLIWVWILFGLLAPRNGQPAYFAILKPSLWWLITSGAVITALFFIVTFIKKNTSQEHITTKFGITIKALLLALPAIFIISFSSTEYGSDVVANRFALQNTLRNSPQYPSFQQDSLRLDSVYSFDLVELYYKPEAISGKRAKTIGMIYRSDDLPEGYDYCFRYVMTCCAADARPVGVFIKQQDSLSIEEKAWYEIEGTVTTDSLDGFIVVKLEDSIIREIPKPENTWLYPK
jgi:uncharacterized repeat protein (TIGR03943 family)